MPNRSALSRCSSGVRTATRAAAAAAAGTKGIITVVELYTSICRNRAGLWFVGLNSLFATHQRIFKVHIVLSLLWLVLLLIMLLFAVLVQ